MNSEPRYVFDASVIVSALLFEKSLPGQAFYAALDHGEVLLSAEVVAELTAVLGRKKFDKYVTPDEREEFLQTLLREAVMVAVTADLQVCRDPRDDKYLALAVTGRAACLISGDQDLLVLHPFQGVSIITPSQFLESLVRKPSNGPS